MSQTPINQDPRNVLILTSHTGGGHQSAAAALEHSFLSQPSASTIQVDTIRVLEEANFLTRQLADFYNYLLRYHQDWVKYYYWAINQLRPNESKLICHSAYRYGRKIFQQACPSVIVSVHPMTNHFFAYVLRKLNLIDQIPIVTVVTDPCYGFWKGWACDDVREYYVATSEAKQQLLDYGVASHKIRIMGMPVHNRFQPMTAHEKQGIRQAYDLDPKKFTVFVNAGWIGGGNIPRIMQELIQADLDIQTIFLAGRNPKLLNEAHQYAETAPFPVKVLSFTSEMEKLMNASDVMISKLGGLTTFEAMATQLPIIADTITPPMPQEAQTASYLTQTGAGILLKETEEVVSVIQSLENWSERFQQLKQAAQRHGTPGASDRIAQHILQSLGAA